MKRLLFIAFTMIVCMACEGPEGPAGPMGPMGNQGLDGNDGKDGQGANWYSTALTVQKSEWRLMGEPGELNSYFYAYKPVPPLTNHIFDKGSVIAYIETDKGVKNGMPFVLHLGEEYDGKEFLWTQTYDFDFEVGGVGLYVTYSDFTTGIPPGVETFHIVLMW